jgi:hypothetical protein
MCADSTASEYHRSLPCYFTSGSIWRHFLKRFAVMSFDDLVRLGKQQRWAGYPGIAADLDTDKIAAVLQR